MIMTWSVSGGRVPNSAAKRHFLFIQSQLRELQGSFIDVEILCGNGKLYQNRLIVALLFPYLGVSTELCITELDNTVLILPDYTMEQIENFIDKKVLGNVGGEEDLKSDYNVGPSTGDAYVSSDCEQQLVVERQVKQELKNDLGYPSTGSFEASENSSLLSLLLSSSIEREVTEPKYLSANDENLLNVSCDKHTPCDVCGKLFRKNELIAHYKVHTKPNQCKFCNKRFARKKACKTHEINFHGDTFEVVLEVGENGQIKKHSNLHSCPECGKMFEALSHLEIHSRMHTKEKPFQCVHCPKGFTTKGNLMAHERIHAGTHKRFPCSVCDKMFSHPSEVKNHEVVHTGSRNYICTRCGTSYRRYSNLWRHLKKCPPLNCVMDSDVQDKVILVAPVANRDKMAAKNKIPRPRTTPKFDVKDEDDYRVVLVDNTILKSSEDEVIVKDIVMNGQEIAIDTFVENF